mmetsp:Transcript_65839/g.182429  ORF Transcript_65839/g.182429 Transcript_65839/m.182429 type:complete len:219 (+) Transcript_65839:1839-2495(+)
MFSDDSFTLRGVGALICRHHLSGSSSLKSKSESSLPSSSVKVSMSPRPFMKSLPLLTTLTPASCSIVAVVSESKTSPGGQCCSRRAALFMVSPKSRKRGSWSPTMPATTGPTWMPARSIVKLLPATSCAFCASVAMRTSRLAKPLPSASAEGKRPHAATHTSPTVSIFITAPLVSLHASSSAENSRFRNFTTERAEQPATSLSNSWIAMKSTPVWGRM